MNRAYQKGVTLVETLVALAVMGFVVSGLLMMIGQNTRFAASLEDRNLAAVAADNLMVEAMVLPDALETGESEGEATAAGRVMRYRRTVIESGVDGVLRIDISVLGAGDQELAHAAGMRSVYETR
jgi:type II secretion system protein I